MTQVVNLIVQLLITDYGNGSNKIILLGSIKLGSKEDILQVTYLFYWHVFRSSSLLTENYTLILLISKRCLTLLIITIIAIFC